MVHWLSTLLVFWLPNVHGRSWSRRDDPSPQPFGFFNDNVIYKPRSGERVEYPRYVELRDGSLLVTSQLNGDGQGFFPIFKSSDGGASWEWISNIYDEANGVGLGAQPCLLELTEDLDDWDAGTILAAGNSADGTATRIDLYASTDGARTWGFVSNVAVGGPPNPNNGGSSIWEPFLLQYNGSVITFYSDQRDEDHGQKLSHQVSDDLQDWDDPVDDVAYPTYAWRPGMTVVAYVPPLSKWIIVHELGKGPRSAYGNRFPVWYRFADSPLDFDSGESQPILVNNKTEAGSSPYVVWSPVGGPNGTIIVTEGRHSEIFINRFGGAVDKWETRPVAEPQAYARAVHVLRNKSDHLLVIGASLDKTSLPLSVTSVNLTALLDSPA